MDLIGKLKLGGAPWPRENSAAVLCSRVRLARNLRGIPFPGSASPEQLAEVAEMAYSAVRGASVLEDPEIFRVDELEPVDVRFLLEEHLVSREFTRKKTGSAVIIGKGASVNIMVNEEDHLRLQVMSPGLGIGEAWHTADRLETELGKELGFAFSDRLGYLTACPTNLGTGLRASVMVHLPCLVLSKRIVKVLTGLSRSGIIPRGAYGEGSEPSGNLFQISNQFTLGRAEYDIIEEIKKSASSVSEEERSARESMLLRDRKTLEDRVYRAYGVLMNARMIGSNEALEMLSHLKLGAGAGLLDIDPEVLNALIVDVRPAHIQKLAGEGLSRRDKEIQRADLIRRKLGG